MFTGLLVATLLKSEFYPIIYTEFFSRKNDPVYFFVQYEGWHKGKYKLATKRESFFYPLYRVYFNFFFLRRFNYCRGEEQLDRCKEEIPKLLLSQLFFVNHKICVKESRSLVNSKFLQSVLLLKIPSGPEVEGVYEEKEFEKLLQISEWKIGAKLTEREWCKE